MAGKVDSDLAELIPEFLTCKRDDVYSLTAAIERTDYQALRSMGHRIKGEGAGFGFETISDIGRAVELAAEARDVAELERLVRSLGEYLELVEVLPTDHAA